MSLCKEGHSIDETNESYGGVICARCGETFAENSNAEIDWPIDDFDEILEDIAIV